MKCIVILIVLFPTILAGQILRFDKRFIQCEDKWVAFQPDKKGVYSFGFIYIDTQAGLTADFQGEFKIQGDKFIPEPRRDTTASFKARLEANHVRVALIPDSKFAELKIDSVPDWLKFYKTDTATVERLYRLGFVYNLWNDCSKALTYLEAGQKRDPKFKGLEFELAYSYNCLQEFDKAITVLTSAVETSPNDCYLYKELSYAEIHLGQLDKASDTCKKGILMCSDHAIKAEIAYNLAYSYYKAGDKSDFKIWYDETKRWAERGDKFMTNLSKMRDDLRQ